MKKEQALTQTTPAGRVSQQAVEFIRLHDSSGLPSVPWKYLVEDTDWFWPVGWFLYPIGDGELWLVKRESPRNIYAQENCELIGIKVNGELTFEETEWNNEVMQIWSKDQVLSLFEDVVRGKYSGVAIWENWSPEERGEAEKWHKLMYVIKALLEDEDRISRYGEFTFLRYAERYYSKFLAELGDFFGKLSKMKKEERITFLKELKKSLWNEGFRNGYFMYIFYP